jgi:hypothetical protein
MTEAILSLSHVLSSHALGISDYIIMLNLIFIKTYTYLLTPRSRILLEKLAGVQLVKKFPTFYGTRRFITAFTGARHLFLS